jgi:hypothetical protein
MIEIEKKDKLLLLKYYSDYQQTDWIDNKLESTEDFKIKGVFLVSKSILFEIVVEDFEGPEFYFIIGTLKDDYYQIDKSVFGISNDFYFSKDLDFHEDFFVAKKNISLLRTIDSNVNEPVFIGGDNETILPIDEFKKLIKNFPTTHELRLYREAKVTSIIGNYFDSVKDKESNFKTYINSKSIKIESNLQATFKDVEILKYSTLVDKLKTMLDNEVKYSEDQWQSEILQLILLLYPKYIKAFKEVKFKDIYSNKTRRLDFGLIDFMGNLDIIEIKIPFEKSIVSKSQYRDNHIPSRDLSGAIMQIEKYIFYLNKTGKDGEVELNKRYKSELPDDLEIRIVNPNAIIIMGRDNQLDKTQLNDFEIIKRKYKNIVDIFTYDELIRRLEILIIQLKKI